MPMPMKTIITSPRLYSPLLTITRRHITDVTGMTPKTITLGKNLLSPSPETRRLALSRCITLIESRSDKHKKQADLLLNQLLNQHQINHSFRLGIAGPPGAGKSTFIERLGLYVLKQHPNEKLSVLCIDPSSSITGGSILGDKTRMMELSRHDRAYVRPSPNRGTLGGLASATSDSVSLCGAAGYNYVFIETVGLGQSEVEISQTVDMLMLLIPPGGGDELQGVKKGIVEVADLLVVNKADGNLLQPAKMTAADYKSAVRLLHRQNDDWGIPPVLLASAHTGDGVEEVWNSILKFRHVMMESGRLREKRSRQGTYWMWKHVQHLITSKTRKNGLLREKAEMMAKGVEEGRLTPRTAAEELLNALWMVENGHRDVA